MDCSRHRRLLALALLPALAACSSPSALRAPDAYTLVASRNLLSGHPVYADEGLVNVVVEIPAGSVAKWEVDKRDGALRWEFKKGRPRQVRYLAYPGNYGMIPRTLLPRELGGDGDPLDVIVLGPALERGSVVAARVVGVLRLLDDGEQDDKLIAVRPGTAFEEVRGLDDLQRDFEGVTRILELWFSHYKGPGEMQARGLGDAAAARDLLEAAAAAYEREASLP